MHETGVIRALISEVERVAHRYGSPRVRTVRVRIGALCPLSEYHLREHFSRETTGTVVEAARLVVELGTDPAGPLAQDVVLDSIELEDVLPMDTRAQYVRAI